MQNLFNEIGFDVGIHLFGDSSASHGTLQRIGAGRIKSLEAKQLWLQEFVTKGEIDIHKIPRSTNSSDVLTHPWSSSEGNFFVQMGFS